MLDLGAGHNICHLIDDCLNGILGKEAVIQTFANTIQIRNGIVDDLQGVFFGKLRNDVTFDLDFEILYQCICRSVFKVQQSRNGLFLRLSSIHIRGRRLQSLRNGIFYVSFHRIRSQFSNLLCAAARDVAQVDLLCIF